MLFSLASQRSARTPSSSRITRRSRASSRCLQACSTRRESPSPRALLCGRDGGRTRSAGKPRAAACSREEAANDARAATLRRLGPFGELVGLYCRASRSRLQVLKAGPPEGKRPLVGTPCSCHYKGTTIDGTEFDRCAGLLHDLASYSCLSLYASAPSSVVSLQHLLPIKSSRAGRCVLNAPSGSDSRRVRSIIRKRCS